MILDPTRDQRFTASMAPPLLAGDRYKIQQMFLRALKDSRYRPDGFENSWPARYGLVIEKLAQEWIMEHGVTLTDIATQYFHPERAWCSCTLDARVVARKGVPCNCVLDKQLTPDDVGRISYNDTFIKRNRSGSLLITRNEPR